MTAARQMPLSLRWDSGPLWAPLKSALNLTPTGAALVVAAVKAGDWVSYSRFAGHYAAPRRYVSSLYSWRKVVRAVDMLDGLGLIDHDKREPGPRGWQSSFRARPALVGIVTAAGDLAALRPAAPKEVIILCDAAGRLRDYADTRETTAMRRRLVAMNEAIGAADLVPDARAPLVRIFNGGWQRGGRFYSLGQGAWQTMSQEARLRLRIDGEPVVELDFRNLHPALLYADAGAPIPSDCYDVPPWPRALVKRALLIAINAATEAQARLAIAHDATMGEKAEPGSQDALRAAAGLMADLRRVHAPIAGSFCAGAGLRLMRWDADIADAVMCEMLRRGIVALPVHDSFIVKASDADALEQAMIEAAEKHGASLRVARK